MLCLGRLGQIDLRPWFGRSRMPWRGVLRDVERVGQLVLVIGIPIRVRIVRCHAPAGSARDVVALLLDLRLLAPQVAQVVELRAADVTAGDDLDLLDDRRVHREGALHSDTEADLADRERLAQAATLAPDDG